MEGLGVTLASLPLIERDIAAGRLVSPLTGPTWRAPDYTLAIHPDPGTDDAVMAFERWIIATAEVDHGPLLARNTLTDN